MKNILYIIILCFLISHSVSANADRIVEAGARGAINGFAMVVICYLLYFFYGIFKKLFSSEKKESLTQSFADKSIKNNISPTKLDNSKQTDISENLNKEVDELSNEVKEVSNMSTVDENEFYAQAWEEIETEKYDKGCYAKAFSMCVGDEKKIKAKYIELRVAQLVDYQKEKKNEQKEKLRKKEVETLTNPSQSDELEGVRSIGMTMQYAKYALKKQSSNEEMDERLTKLKVLNEKERKERLNIESTRRLTGKKEKIIQELLYKESIDRKVIRDGKEIELEKKMDEILRNYGQKRYMYGTRIKHRNHEIEINDRDLLQYKLVFYDTRLYKITDEYPFTDLVLSKYGNGQLKNKGNIVNGKRQGYWEFWHESGQKEATGYYFEGNRDGYWEFWSEDGEQYEIEKYERGTLVDIAVR